MSGTIIALLWAAIYIVVLCVVVYVILWAIRSVIAIPEIIERAVWVVVVLLVCIWIISALAGGGLRLQSPFRSGLLSGPAVAALSVWPAPNYKGAS
jgi:hypothetical protein